jgi:eukaryotic-like serine/threonine-protein kinase
MSEDPQCQTCGVPLNGLAVDGFCANCLLGLALKPSDDVTFPLPAGSAAPHHVRYFGDYELIEEIARGGMGVVYKARQVSLNRTVALKMILAGDFSSPAMVERFRTEAEASARLDHPNIVPIFEIGTHQAQLYFSMRFIEGGTLTQAIAKEKLSPRHAAELMVQVARAVHHAHQRGILHRDLKPGNILFDQAGQPHVADFGLAKLLEHDSNLTQSAAVMGTPSYMAPEQAAGHTKEATTSVDIYGLGAVLYELLTRRPPFTGNPFEVLAQVREREPAPPRSIHSEADRDLSIICMKCLEKDPRRRYGSAEALAEDLQRWLNCEPIQARHATPPERVLKWARRKPVVAGLVLAVHCVALLGLIGILWQWQRAEHNADEAKASATENRKRLVTFHVATGARIMDDDDYFGALLWFAKSLQMNEGSAASENDHRVRIATLLRHSPRLLQLRGDFGSRPAAVFSRSGNYIAAAGESGAVEVWNTEAADPVVLQRLEVSPSSSGALISEFVRRLLFHPNERQLLVLAADWANLWDISSGQLMRRFTHPQLHRAVFSEDGSQLATGSADGSIIIWDVFSGDRKFSVKHQAVVECLAFSRDGRQLASGSRNQTAVIWDLRNGQNQVVITNTGRVLSADFNPDGTRLVVTCDIARVARVWDAQTGQPLSLPMLHEGNIFSARFSPNGRYIATASEDFTAKIWDAETGALVSRTLRHANRVLDAVFSPDGRLLLTRGFDGFAQVWEVPSGKPFGPPLRHGGLVRSAAFHPDGDRVLTASADGCVRLWQPSPGAQPFLPWPDPGRLIVSATPDGNRLITQESAGAVRVWDPRNWQPLSAGTEQSNHVYRAWLSGDETRLLTEGSGPGGPHATQIDLWEFPSSRRLQTLNLGSDWTSAPRAYRVSADCSVLAFLWPDRILVLDVRTGGSLPTPDVLTKPLTAMSISPDGRRIAVAGGNYAWTWFISTGEEALPPLLHATGVVKVQFSPDGLLLATACSDSEMAGREAQLWNAITGQPFGNPMRHADGVATLEFSPDSRKLATGCEDETVRVWDSQTTRPLSSQLRHRSAVDHLRFSSDGNWIVGSSAGRAAAARVWNSSSGEPLMPPVAHAESNGQGFFLAQGKYLLTTSNRIRRLWDLSPDDRPLNDLLALSELLSGHRIDETGVFQPLPAESLIAESAKLKSKYPRQFAFLEPAMNRGEPLTQAELRRRFFAHPTIASIAFDSALVEDGLELRQNDDGRTEPAVVAGSKCQRLAGLTNTNSTRFIYFAIEPSRKSREIGDAVVVVEYFEGSSGRLTIDYDAAGPADQPQPYAQSNRVLFTGEPEWKTAFFHLPRARFKNSQNVGADFRLSIRGDAFHVRRVGVTLLPVLVGVASTSH